MEIILALGGIAGLALLLQAKPLPSESDFKKAQEKLAINADDPDANRTAGKYLAFVVGDYAAAMPFLSKSSDKTLKVLADHEMDAAYTDSPYKKIGMGDEWVVAAKNFPPLAKIFYERASRWYGISWPDLDGIWKDKARAQLRKILQNEGVPNPAGIKAPTGWRVIDPNQKASPTTKAVRTGKASFQIVAGKNPSPQYVSIEQVINPVPGRKYDFSAWVLSDGTDSSLEQITAVAFAQGGKMIGGLALTVPQDQPWWHKLETTFDVPQDTAFIQIHITVGSKAGNLFYQDISFKADGKELIKNGLFEQ